MMAMSKDPAAVRLGSKGGMARARCLTAEQLSDAGREAVRARWAKYYREHPEKLKAARKRKKAGRRAA